MAAAQLATLADRTLSQQDTPDLKKDSPKSKRPNLVSEQIKKRDQAKADSESDALEGLTPAPVTPIVTNSTTGIPMMSPVAPVSVSPGMGISSMWPSPANMMNIPGSNGSGMMATAASGLLQIAPGVSSAVSDTNMTMSPSALVSGSASESIPAASSTVTTVVTQATEKSNVGTSAPNSLQGQIGMAPSQAMGMPFNNGMVNQPMFPLNGPIPVGTVQNQGLQGTVVLGPNGNLILVNENTPPSAYMGINNMNQQQMGNISQQLQGMGQQVPQVGNQVVQNNNDQSNSQNQTTSDQNINKMADQMQAGRLSGNVTMDTSNASNMQSSSNEQGLIGLPPVASQALTSLSSNTQHGNTINQSSNVGTMNNQSLAPMSNTQQATTVVQNSGMATLSNPGASQNSVGFQGVMNQNLIGQPGVIGQPPVGLPGQTYMNNGQISNQNMQMNNAGQIVMNNSQMQQVIPGQQMQQTLSTGQQQVVPGQPGQTGQPGNLPHALILPNGQIVPVVTQPQLLFQQATPITGSLVVAQNTPTAPVMSNVGNMRSVNNMNMQMPNQVIPGASTNLVHSGSVAQTVNNGTSITSATQPVSVLSQPISSAQISQTISNAAAAAGILSSTGQMNNKQSVMNVPFSTYSQRPTLVSSGAPQKPIKAATSVSVQPMTQLPSTATAMIAPDGSIILTLAPSSSQTGHPNIKPKPGNGVVVNASKPKPKKAKSKKNPGTASKSASTTAGTSVTEPLSITTDANIGTATTTTKESPMTSTTDILAKAAESIFSSISSDVSPPISSFYNPAHEDNALQIDTSAPEHAESEEVTLTSPKDGLENRTAPVTKNVSETSSTPISTLSMDKQFTEAYVPPEIITTSTSVNMPPIGQPPVIYTSTSVVTVSTSVPPSNTGVNTSIPSSLTTPVASTSSGTTVSSTSTAGANVTSTAGGKDMPPPLTATGETPPETKKSKSKKKKKKSKSKENEANTHVNDIPGGNNAASQPPVLTPQITNPMVVDMESSNTDDVEHILKEAEKLTKNLPDSMAPLEPPENLLSPLKETPKKSKKKSKKKDKEKPPVDAEPPVISPHPPLPSDEPMPALSMPESFDFFGIPMTPGDKSKAKETPNKAQPDKPEKGDAAAQPTKKSRSKSGKRKASSSVASAELPEKMTFTADQLSDVLDTVEGLGDIAVPASSSKKSKSHKKGHENADTESSPVTKKRKKSGKNTSSESIDSVKDTSSASTMETQAATKPSEVTPISQAMTSKTQSPKKSPTKPSKQESPPKPKETKKVEMNTPKIDNKTINLVAASPLTPNIPERLKSSLGGLSASDFPDLRPDRNDSLNSSLNEAMPSGAEQDSSLMSAMDLFDDNLNLLSEMANHQSALDADSRDTSRVPSPTGLSLQSAVHTNLPSSLTNRVHHDRLPQVPSRPVTKSDTSVTSNNSNSNLQQSMQQGNTQNLQNAHTSVSNNVSRSESVVKSSNTAAMASTSRADAMELASKESSEKKQELEKPSHVAQSSPPALNHSAESLFSPGSAGSNITTRSMSHENLSVPPASHENLNVPSVSSANSVGPPSNSSVTQNRRNSSGYYGNTQTGQQPAQPTHSDTLMANFKPTRSSPAAQTQPPALQHSTQPVPQKSPYPPASYANVHVTPCSGQSTTVASSNPTYTQPSSAPSFSFSLSGTTSSAASGVYNRQSGYHQFPNPFYPMAPGAVNEQMSGKGGMREQQPSMSDMSADLNQRNMRAQGDMSSQRREQHVPSQVRSHSSQGMAAYNMSSNTSVQQQQREPNQCMQMSRERETNQSTRMPGPSPTQPASAGSHASQVQSNRPQSSHDPNPFYQPNSFSGSSSGASLTSPPLHHNQARPASSNVSTTSSYPSSYSSVQQYNPPPSFGASSFDPPPLVYSQGSTASSHSRTDSCAASHSVARKKSSHDRGEDQRVKSNTASVKQHQPVEPHPPPSSQKTSSRSSKNKSKSKQYDMHENMNLFDPSRSMTPFFQLSGMSPPPRNLPTDATYLPPMFGGHSRPMSTTSSQQHKNSDMTNPFNPPLFPPARGQNGFGLNFQPPGFGMNNAGNSQITPHSSAMSMPHMSNFNFANIFTDMNNHSQNDSLNISPIKFPPGNLPLPPQAGMDHNSLQHHHQGALYHNRPHLPPHQPVLHNAMSINSILGQHPHGFESRPMGPGLNSTPFPAHGHTPTFGMHPPLNFSMHDH